MFLYVTICIKVLNAIINLNIPLQCIYPLPHTNNEVSARHSISVPKLSQNIIRAIPI
jgi:hypothetical protein